MEILLYISRRQWFLFSDECGRRVTSVFLRLYMKQGVDQVFHYLQQECIRSFSRVDAMFF